MAVSAARQPALSAAEQIGAERRFLLTLAVGALLLSLLMARLLLQLQVAAVVLLFGLLLLAAVLCQPRLGLYTVFGLVLLCEPGGPDPLMTPGTYLIWGLQSSLGLNGVIINPIE